MRQISVFFLLFLLINTISSAQPKIEVGLTTEGSRVMEKEFTKGHPYLSKHSWGTGGGFYISMPVWWRFGVSSGIKYRNAELQWAYPYIEEEGDMDFSYKWCNTKRRYLVVPLNLQLLFTRNCFITGGIEYCRLLNHYNSIKNPEYNWTIGIGSQKYKLHWSLQYLRGFEEQHEKNHWLYLYKTKRLQLSLSYPLWKN